MARNSQIYASARAILALVVLLFAQLAFHPAPALGDRGSSYQSMAAAHLVRPADGDKIIARSAEALPVKPVFDGPDHAGYVPGDRRALSLHIAASNADPGIGRTGPTHAAVFDACGPPPDPLIA